MNRTSVIFYGFFFIPFSNNFVETFNTRLPGRNAEFFAHNQTIAFFRPFLISSKFKPENHFLQSNDKGHRQKRGVIWNKIKEMKSGMWSAKKKLWKIKVKAVEIINGKDVSTPKPHYESTGGSWGNFQAQRPKGNHPLLSGIHGPPYHESASSSKIKLRNAGWGWNNQRSSGSSIKLSQADLMTIYNLPISKQVVLLNYLRELSRRLQSRQ